MPDLSDRARLKVRAAAQDLRLWLLEAGESAAIAREAWLNEFDEPAEPVEQLTYPEMLQQMRDNDLLDPVDWRDVGKHDIDRDGPPAFRS